MRHSIIAANDMPAFILLAVWDIRSHVGVVSLFYLEHSIDCKKKLLNESSLCLCDTGVHQCSGRNVDAGARQPAGQVTCGSACCCSGVQRHHQHRWAGIPTRSRLSLPTLPAVFAAAGQTEGQGLAGQGVPVQQGQPTEHAAWYVSCWHWLDTS